MSRKRGAEMNYEHDIKTLLTIGENIVIEFKRAGNGPEHDTYESICAFLNRQGGDVLLGRADELGRGVDRKSGHWEFVSTAAQLP